MAVTNNLYPPIVDTYMPAFLVQKNAPTTVKSVSYKTTSYADINAYNSAFNQYIVNSSALGIYEDWQVYQARLADIEEQYPQSEWAARKLALELEFKAYLELKVYGSELDATNRVFFIPEPEVVEVTKTAEVKTLATPTTDKRFICRVYFALSPYNSLSEIANAQVTVRSQLNNSSVLHKVKYPSEVMLKQIQLDPARDSDNMRDKYFIDILPEDLNDCNFTVDQFYKVQIRFTSINAGESGIDLTEKDAVQAIDSWLTNNLQYFSEWSTVCLVRGISIPTITLKDFDEYGSTDIWDTIINTKIIGKLSFQNSNETETLRSYRIQVYEQKPEGTNDVLLTDSGDIFSNDFTELDSFDYTLKYWFQVGTPYYFTLTYVTSNLYTETKKYLFNVIAAEVPDIDLQITAYADEENGRIGMHITRSVIATPYTGYVIIRRASVKDNFMIWEDMCTFTYEKETFIDISWYDYTIESGIFYWYGIQPVSPDGARRAMHMFKEPLMINFDHMFLTTKDKQLKIKFNPSLSSFKRTISETKIDTIGSQYPFIKRNGYIDYVQFPIGGLISSEVDEDGLFTTKEEIYGNNAQYYAEYNEENNIGIHQDMVWEKAFRDEVNNFLHADDVKLFRSPTEGNLLIKLMDINFQPNQVLGRRLWSFTANAYEIDKCSLENYEKYNIFTREVYQKKIEGSDGDKLKPIRRIIFIENAQDFPPVGEENVLYIYNNDIYVWVASAAHYQLISVPLWDDDTDLSGLVGSPRCLYTDDQDLYIWNDKTQEYERISVPSMEG